MGDKMELVYLYIKEMNGFISDQHINFSDNFEVQLSKEGILNIEKKENPLKGFYGDNIKNMTLLVGKNGSGKTTILDILGGSYEDRARIGGEYFILYSIDDDHFGIEYRGTSIFNEVIKNVKIVGDTSYRNSKGSMGIVFKYENKEFLDTGKEFFNHIHNEWKLSHSIHFNYLKDFQRDSNRIFRNNEYGHLGYIGIRNYGKLLLKNKYLTLVRLLNNEGLNFNNNSIELKIGFSKLNRAELELEKKINKILVDLGKFSFDIIISMHLIGKKREKPRLTKENWLINILCTYIEDMFTNLLRGLEVKEVESHNKYLIDMTNESDIKFINNLNIQSNTEERLGSPSNQNLEVENLKKIINYSSPKSKKNDFLEHWDTLIKISRYLASRLEARNNFEEFNFYQAAFEDAIEQLNKIPEKYFHIDRDTVIFKMNEINFAAEKGLSEEISELLQKSDYWKENEPEKHNQINDIFDIKFNNLSEGEENLVNILSMIESNIFTSSCGINILLLDEPDLGLHPEWARTFTYELNKILTALEGQFQVIMTTHSPYLVSDQLPENVYRFSRKEGLEITRFSDFDNLNSCFGANIHTLYRDGFFLNNTLGELATNTIKNVIKEFDDIEELLKDNRDDEAEILIEKKEIYRHIINRVGEPYLKTKLEEKYNKLFMSSISKEEKLTTILNKLSKEEVELLRIKLGDQDD